MRTEINSSEFRPLNQRERDMIFSFATKENDQKTGLPHQSRIPLLDLYHIHHNHFRVSYERMQGGFTVCLLVLVGLANENPENDPVTVYLWRGVSRRSYKDKLNPIRGEMLAFRRAVLFSRTVTL